MCMLLKLHANDAHVPRHAHVPCHAVYHAHVATLGTPGGVRYGHVCTCLSADCLIASRAHSWCCAGGRDDTTMVRAAYPSRALDGS